MSPGRLAMQRPSARSSGQYWHTRNWRDLMPEIELPIRHVTSPLNATQHLQMNRLLTLIGMIWNIRESRVPTQ